MSLLATDEVLEEDEAWHGGLATHGEKGGRGGAPPGRVATGAGAEDDDGDDARQRGLEALFVILRTPKLFRYLQVPKPVWDPRGQCMRTIEWWRSAELLQDRLAAVAMCVQEYELRRLHGRGVAPRGSGGERGPGEGG